MNNNRYGLPGEIREISPEEALTHSKYLKESTDYQIHGHAKRRLTTPERLYKEAVRDALKQVTLTGFSADFFTVKIGDIDLTRTSCDISITLFEKKKDYWPDKTI